MKVYSARGLNYKDNLARQHRRHFLVKLILLIFAFLVVLSGIIYFLFFSKVLEVRGISLNGLTSMDNKFVYDDIRNLTDKKTAGFVQIQKNILFFNTNVLKAKLLSQAPVFRNIQIKKKLLHNIEINFIERKPVGTWCLKDQCSYFDNDRVLWGDTAKSSGFLMLSVVDNRDVVYSLIPEDFFNAVIKVYSALSVPSSKIKVKNISISGDTLSEFRVYTDRNYYIVFSLDSDLSGQLDVLNIFLNSKENDSSFNPAYLDLTIDGRVYYK